MKEWKDRAEVSFVTDISRFDYLRQQIQEVAENSVSIISNLRKYLIYQ